MSKTAGCVFALGVCMVLAAACGDDDGGPATGGNGGAAGAGGGAGTGSAGRAGGAGAGGAPMGGSGGTPSGGASGAPAGAAGEGGNGGSAGDGLDPDGGVPDGGNGPLGTCPAFPASALQIQPQNEQQLAIARVLFLADGSADVVIRNILEPLAGDAGSTRFPINAPVHLCSGPTNCALLEDICDEAGDDLDLFAGEEAVCNIDATAAAEGELGIMSNDVEIAAAFSFAYIAWDVAGGFVSQPPPPVGGDAGVATSLEDRAANRDGPDFWTNGQRIAVSAGEDTIVGTGETAEAAGFVSCDR